MHRSDHRLRRRSVLAGGALLAAGPRARAQAKLPISFWHGMSGEPGDEVNRICASFNASQAEVEIRPFYKGSYVEVMIATVAAWRAGVPPHIAQIYDIGTGTMQASAYAAKPAWQLFRETGVAFDPAAYIPAVRAYYGTADGRMQSMPFNSSTGLMWINRDAFKRAGLDPDHPPATWDDVVAAVHTPKAKGAAEVPLTTASPSWIHFEMFSAIHNIPFASGGNGFDGLNVELKFNSPAHVRNLQRLLDLHKDGLFKLNGRDRDGDPVFPTGRAGITTSSSASRGQYKRDAKFAWSACFLPYDQTVIAKPINSTIGGASLWTLTAKQRTGAEYAAVARFLHFIANPDMDALWHQRTGYVPVTLAGYEKSRDQGYYDKNPGADLPILQLTRHQPTANSRGIRLGRMPEVRDILEEEIERSMGGEKGAQAALDSAVERGNRVLREFERSTRQ